MCQRHITDVVKGCELKTSLIGTIFKAEGVSDHLSATRRLSVQIGKEPVMYKRILTSALLFGMACTGPPAWALSCAPREALVARLTSDYAETLTARGLQNGAALIEVWTSADRGSFTILLTRPDGISCVMSTGTHWMMEDAIAASDGVAG